MKKFQEKKNNIRKITYLAVLTALVVVLMFSSSLLRIGSFSSASLVLIPIVIGAALLGPLAGAWLGLVFSFIVLISPETATFMTFNFFATVLVILLKGTLAGFAAGIVYKLLNKVNLYLAIIVAAIVAPSVNTGIFIIGCLLFFMEIIGEIGASFGFGDDAVSYLFYGMIGISYFVEVGVNLVLSPITLRLLNIKKKF